MELIYIYIEKYRLFQQQEFHFSDKFKVHYDRDKNQLSIDPNIDYIDIYPKNIVGISAIVGKNAAGKTSLLSLIGDKIEDRWQHHEIFEEETEDPFEKLDIFQDSAKDGVSTFPPHACEYFLIYYMGQDASKKNIFVLETNSPRKYYSIFTQPNFLAPPNVSHEEKLNYYEGKGWLSCVFYGEGTTNRTLCNTQNFSLKTDSPSVQETSTVIYFQKDFPNLFGGYDSLSEEESKICIKKRYAILHERWKYRQLLMLQRLMRDSSETDMYRRDSYQLQITLADADTFFDGIDENGDKIDLDAADAIVDYRKYDFQEKSQFQKMVLDFLEKYVEYAFASFINNYSNNVSLEGKSTIYYDLKGIKPTNSHFDSITEAYLQQLNVIFSGYEDKEHLLNRIRKAIDSYFSFLQNSEEYQMHCEYKPSLLVIHITKDSQLEQAEDFFTNVIDESIASAIEQEPSALGRFLESTIFPLSAGEAENLALFTSVSDQIVKTLPHKKDYILLFDEIERSMHPEMCRNLISYLIDFLGNYSDKSFQIIIASHSPFIVGDLRKDNLICLSPADKPVQQTDLEMENSFAQNIHTLLKSKFFLENTFSRYAVDTTKIISRCLGLDSLSDIKNEIRKKLDPNGEYPLKKLPHNEKETLHYLRAMISSIGEPLIRHSLENELGRWCKRHPSPITRQEELERLHARIAELEELEGVEGND